MVFFRRPVVKGIVEKYSSHSYKEVVRLKVGRYTFFM